MSARTRVKDAAEVEVGGLLPELVYSVTATTVAQGAAASRDWQPQHHDYAWAQRVGTQDIFLNTPTQGGWICRFITDWSGPYTRFGRITYRMRSPIYPGDNLRFSGEVVSTFTDEMGGFWAALKVALTVDGKDKTAADVLVSLPHRNGIENPWSRKGREWKVPDFPGT